MIQQIPKIRIGNTIHVGLAVMAGGQPRDLTGLVLTVVLVDNRGSKARINGWTIEGEHNNVIRFTLQGFTQNNCGIYKVIVYENANKPNQAVVDSRLFELVRESAMEEGVDSGLIDKDVDLQIGGILIGGRDGTGIADIQQVQSSSVSLGENIWKITLTDGREYNIVIKNGEQGPKGNDGDDGEDGYTPVKGVDYFTPSEISDIKENIKDEIGGDFYTKPSGGIPKSDLSDEVKTSLGKADSALQSFTESDPTVPAWAKQPSKPTYTAQEVGALPSSTPIPTKTSDLDNDSGFLTQHQDISGKQDVIDDLQTIRSGAAKGETALQSFTETDPTVPSWAKQSTKPSYTASEVGALPDTTKYAGSQSAGGAANKAVSLPTGIIDTENSVSTAYVASVDGITELQNGTLVLLYNESLRSASAGWTLNINGLGAKPVYLSQSNTRAADIMGSKSFYLFVYDTIKVAGGSWQLYTGLDTDTDVKAYRILRQWTTHISSALMYREMMLFTKSENLLLPVNSYNRSSATDKVLTSEEFDPFGQIWYYSGAATIQAGATIAANVLFDMYDLIDIRYSFNTGSTLTASQDVFVVAVPQSNGKAKLAANPISQTLPSTEDGFIYIRLGQAFDTYRIALDIVKPIYYFKDGAIRQWTNQDTTALKLGTSTVGGTTQGIYLNQGVPAACESYDMWYMKHIAALYGATRNDATGLWSYYYTNCARWDDDNEQIVWDRNIGYDDITDAEMASMIDNRIFCLVGVYGFGSAIQSRIAFHVRGYGNNNVSAPIYVYLNNRVLQTFGYMGTEARADGQFFVAYTLRDVGSVANLKFKHIIGKCNSAADQSAANANVLKELEYITMAPRKANHIFDFSYLPKLEFVSVMYCVTHDEGLQWSGCKLILHPDVYAKIFDSTNADYALWHKIDLANQARTNPITIQSA